MGKSLRFKLVGKGGRAFLEMGGDYALEKTSVFGFRLRREERKRGWSNKKGVLKQ